jgi:hypothetical protein
MQPPQVGDHWPEQETNFPGTESLKFSMETIYYFLPRRRSGVVHCDLLAQPGDCFPQLLDRGCASRVMSVRPLREIRARDHLVGLYR